MRRFVLALTVMFIALPILAQEDTKLDPAGQWIARTKPSSCLDIAPEAKEVAVRIVKSGQLYRIEGLRNTIDASLDGNFLSGTATWIFSVNDHWFPGKPAAAVADLNQVRKTYSFSGRLSDDGSTISGQHTAGCYGHDGSSFTEGPIWYEEEISLNRTQIKSAIVSIDKNNIAHDIPSFSIEDTIHVAVYFSENWIDENINIDKLTWSDNREQKDLGSIELSQSENNLNLYLSPAIDVRSAMVEDNALGSSADANGLQIWGRPGTTLTAEIIGVGTAEASLEVYSFLEALVETTTALLLFALLAFLVERLTNGVSLILGYSDFWQRHFEELPDGERAANARNYRNRRVFLFFLGIAVAVPLCVLFGFNIVDQLQLPPMVDPIAEQVGTGLLAATGADPIREIILSGEGGEGRFSFNRGSGSSKTIHVKAQLVAPPGSTIHVAEAAKDTEMNEQASNTKSAREPETEAGDARVGQGDSDQQMDAEGSADAKK